MQSAQLPEVTELKYLEPMETSEQEDGWNNWMKMSGVLCDNRIPPHVKGKIRKMSVQPAMLYGMETVPMTSSHVKKLKVIEMKMGRWACGHTL